MEQNELLENNENDNVLEFDYTGTDQAGNLADMAEYSGSVVKTKIQAFYNEPISVAELGRCPR